MKKLGIVLGLMMMFMAADAHAHQAVRTDAVVVSEDGLKFNNVIISMEPQNRMGAIFFAPSNPSAKPVEKNSLSAANTVGKLKSEIVKAVNAKMDRDPLSNYNPIAASDVFVYGGYSVQTENSFTDARVFGASKAGSVYRVKIVLTPKDPKQTIQTAIQGTFTLYGVE